ncbi:MAG: hypothetical protein JWN34_5714 [Bryobacterales bacterium]|nr:hypothetical protein [Bryobacterales bacterium]
MIIVQSIGGRYEGRLFSLEEPGPGDRDGSSKRDAVLDKGCGKVGYSSLRRGTAQVITGEAGRQGAAKSEQGSLDRWAIAGRRSLLYSAAPHAAPSAARASSAGGAMRAGINGSLSAISSPAAQTPGLWPWLWIPEIPRSHQGDESPPVWPRSPALRGRSSSGVRSRFRSERLAGLRIGSP